MRAVAHTTCLLAPSPESSVDLADGEHTIMPSGYRVAS